MTRFENGWIKLHRRVVNEDIGRHSVRLAVWVTLLSWATRYETTISWKGDRRVIPPGSVLCGNRELARHLGVSKDSIARALRALASRESIRIETAPRGTLINICNWADYQGTDETTAPISRQSCDTGEPLVSRSPDLTGEVKNKEEIHIDQRKRRSSAFKSAFDLEAAYRLYPKKVGKTKGLQKLARDIQSQKDFDLLIVAIRRYCQSREVRDGYVRHFSTFATDWRDWVDPDAGAVQGEAEATKLSEVTPV